MVEQLGLIGCGLMGGSFALALKKAGAVRRVVGYSKSPSTTERARQLGVIDVAAPSALLAASGADLVLIAVPVSATEATLKAIRHVVTPGMLIMDVGSTKGDVVEAAQRALKDQAACFVPAHPIAGKEQAGVDYADATLYAGRPVILTPTPQTAPARVRQACDLWGAVGARVVQATPQEHDATFAAVSHLPHLLAFTLMNSVAGHPQGSDHLRLAGPGFRDLTRIAASDVSVWRDILMANRSEVLVQLGLFRDQLDVFESALRNADAPTLAALITQASATRKAWRMTQFD